MTNHRSSPSTSILILFLLILTVVPASALTAPLRAAAREPVFAIEIPNEDPPTFAADLPTELLLREAKLVAAINQRRRAAGVPPLRWNRELSEAARWFAHDAVETLVTCGNTDSLGRGPATRVRAFGFTQLSKFAEAVVCGFTEPNAAVAAWMTDAYQRTLLLDPALREAGAGYYYSIEKGRGYIVLDVGLDGGFGPAVINDEALFTASSAVTLTVHAQATPAVAMKVSNVPAFDGVEWEPFVAERQWTLEEGRGWNWVYVLTRDAVGRTSLLSDVIFHGEAAPASEITLDHATNIGAGFAISGLKPPSNALLRLSLGWLIDSEDPAFAVVQGTTATEADPNALGGSAMRLLAGGADNIVEATADELPHDRILTAYVRLKTPLAGGDAELGSIRVRIGDQTVNTHALRASDFAAAGVWQEFALDFAFGSSPASVTQVEIQRTGDADLVVDAVRFFGRAIPVEQAGLWSAGSSYYRSRGVVGRYEIEGEVGEPFDVAFATVDAAALIPGPSPALKPDRAELAFVSNGGVLTTTTQTVFVCAPGCGGVAWQATTPSTWLSINAAGDGLIVSPVLDGLASGRYKATVTLTPTHVPDGVTVAAASFVVKLNVDYLEDPTTPPPTITPLPYGLYLPMVLRP